MIDRASDRRSHPRFEIVGRFLGSLEVWRRFEIRNLGRGGALVKTPGLCQPGTRLQGRVSVGGRHESLRAAVRHVIPLSPREGGGLAGLELQEALPDVSIGLFEHADMTTPALSIDGERRRSPRVERPEHVALEFCEWMTVELRDVSIGGAMFLSKMPIEKGTHALFHTRFGERRFTSQIDVRRVTQPGPLVHWEIAASFDSMDQESRGHLTSFLTTSSN